MSVVERATWVIERNLTQELTLESLAQACGVSRFHLSHAFGQTVGRPVIQYLRERRLSEAACRLAREKRGVLDVALEVGYGSNEAFTRAFRALLGVTPEAVKRRADLAGLALVEPLHRLLSTSEPLEEPRRETPGALNFIGLAENQRLGRTAGIPGQWGRFMELFAAIPEVIDPIPWGVAFPADDDGRFRYVAAAKVAAGGLAPRGLSRLRLEAQTYLVFCHRTHASRIGETVGAIWNDWLPASGAEPVDAPSLERHSDGFDTTTGLGGVEIWVPVRL
ncbi:AraC family transcriptional regulator [Phenylobacterium sp.]|uniref:AraC family transcriptional regulator n=1 Tax=Phenylobacterium sp. TaxID=1871053 RepID=UPI0012136259|nr:AraC family transcriptional regulator [Phenylobacterium sp.]THD57475.1 MAG: AraC family transcriptional regulator [Phenylobacterium sp.]